MGFRLVYSLRLGFPSCHTSGLGGELTSAVLTAQYVSSLFVLAVASVAFGYCIA
jgi:hypothetical protein